MQVELICKAAGVIRVTAHGMRGTHATLATERGVTGHVVAAALGHESAKTTYRSYARAEAVSSSRQASVLRVLDGASGDVS